MIKQGSVSSVASTAGEAVSKAGRWLFTKKVKPKMFGSQAGQARKVIEGAGKKLDPESAKHLNYIASGGKYPTGKAKKLIRSASSAHDVREASITKPLTIGAIGVGTVAGMRTGKKERYDLRMPDRAPQLTQDPSRVLY